MRIGVSMRVQIAATGEARDAVAHDLVNFLARDGHEVVLIPNSLASVEDFVRRLSASALVLSGGDDILVGVPRAGSSDAVLALRDSQERRLIRYALENGLPLLGICRGFQMINNYLGGTLRPVEPTLHLARSHEVRFRNGFFESLVGSDAFVVNSYHTLGIAPALLAPGLVPLAVAEDESIEAARLAGAPVLGIMWHAERAFQDDPASEFHARRFTELVIEKLNS